VGKDGRAADAADGNRKDTNMAANRTRPSWAKPGQEPLNPEEGWMPNDAAIAGVDWIEAFREDCGPLDCMEPVAVGDIVKVMLRRESPFAEVVDVYPDGRWLGELLGVMICEDVHGYSGGISSASNKRR
jgi:hypothetical protein